MKLAESNLTVPTVHLNGTSAESLIDGYEKAGLALQSALDALTEAGPNARDYYVAGPAAYGKAADEHTARCVKVRDVLREIEWLAVAVADQRDARRRR